MILWGPPGCGKTTIARLLAEDTDLHFEPLSAVFSGVADLRRDLRGARASAATDGKGTLLFVDEIHRFNRAQQDGFLPYVEDGTVTLVGATTENPSFELNAALLSRCQVLVLQPPRRCGAVDACWRAPSRRWPASCRSTTTAGSALLRHGRRRRPLPDQPGRAAAPGSSEQGAGAAGAAGDAAAEARAALRQGAGSALQPDQRAAQIAARLRTSTRRSTGSRACSTAARTRYTSRAGWCASPSRISAWPIRNALAQALAAWDTYDRLGSPEGELAIAQARDLSRHGAEIECGLRGLRRGQAGARETHGSLMPPMHILNAPTRLMKDIGYGKGYEYDHNAEDGFSGQNYFPGRHGARATSTSRSNAASSARS